MSVLNRRRVLSAGKEENPYAGFTTGRIYNTVVYRNADVTDGTASGGKVSPEFSVTGGHVIVYNYHSSGKYPKDVFGTDWAEQSMKGILLNGNLEASSGSNNYLGARNYQVKNVVTLSANVVTLIVCTTFALDDFYVYDRTAGEYIYKGKNITANTQ